MEVALLYFVILALAFFFLIVRPQRRRVTTHRAFVSALELGDEVVTTGGIFGVIRALDGDRVSLEIAPATVVTVARAAIAQPAYPAEPAEPDAEAERGDDEGSGD